MKNKTKLLTKEEARKSLQWFVLDASGKTLGRFAAELTKILRGKHKPTYTPHVDSGDGVIVTNIDKIKVTGAKEAQKIYYHYTGMVGGLKETPYRTMLEKKPEYILFHAVKGMMPKTKLGRKQMKKLRIFRGDTHPMQAQTPKTVNI